MKSGARGKLYPRTCEIWYAYPWVDPMIALQPELEPFSVDKTAVLHQDSWESLHWNSGWHPSSQITETYWQGPKPGCHFKCLATRLFTDAAKAVCQRKGSQSACLRKWNTKTVYNPLKFKFKVWCIYHTLNNTVPFSVGTLVVYSKYKLNAFSAAECWDHSQPFTTTTGKNYFRNNNDIFNFVLIYKR